jgi:hypothetical protein
MTTVLLCNTLEAFARSLAAFSATVPVVTAKLVQDLLNFNFVGNTADNIKMGFHPFTFQMGMPNNAVPTWRWHNCMDICMQVTLLSPWQTLKLYKLKKSKWSHSHIGN